MVCKYINIATVKRKACSIVQSNVLGYISLLNYAARSMTLKWEDLEQLATKWQLKAQLMLTAWSTCGCSKML